jgi:hypothetical protein
VHVRQDRARGFQTLDPFERAADVRVGWVWGVAQRVDDPEL